MLTMPRREWRAEIESVLIAATTRVCDDTSAQADRAIGWLIFDAEIAAPFSLRSDRHSLRAPPR
jgi:hypothetical protein